MNNWCQCFLQYLSFYRSSGLVHIKLTEPPNSTYHNLHNACFIFVYSWVCLVKLSILDTCAFLRFIKVNSKATLRMSIKGIHGDEESSARLSLLVWILREWKLFALSLWLLDLGGFQTIPSSVCAPSWRLHNSSGAVRGRQCYEKHAVLYKQHVLLNWGWLCSCAFVLKRYS